MYPDWPRSTADLVPLPDCDGPKLMPFDFQGPQKIEFLNYLQGGLHSHVFKVLILNRVYALKLFRFSHDSAWISSPMREPFDDLEICAFAKYAEPFNAECRAFGRLQESGHSELAIECFGYVLLDEEHERAMMDKFGHLRLEFEGNPDSIFHSDGLRSRFLGRDGRPPPFRCIVKAFGQGDEPLRARDAKRILRDVIQLQQLGIIKIDIAHRQIISGKLADFSTAITTPHFETTPELNPRIAPEWIRAMEFSTFVISMVDYWDFDNMIREWNDEHEARKDQLSCFALPRTRSGHIHYDLRSRPSWERIYTIVDPRLYDWRASPNAGKRSSAATETCGQRSGSEGESSRRGKSRGAISKTHRRLHVRPPRWYYDCDSEMAYKLRTRPRSAGWLGWEVKDGFIFPRKWKW